MAKRELNLKTLRTLKTKTRAFAVFLLAAVLGTSAAAQAPTTSELLQKGIYLQETVGDLDAAIKIYRQIIQMAQQSRANAAEAEYRLGVCLQKKGQHAESAGTFQKLLKDYPEQAEAPANTRESLPREDCVSFNPATAATMMVDGRWKVMDGLHRMFDFGSDESEAKRTLEVIRHYNMNESCFVGRPRAPFKYLLISGASPVGAMLDEDCDKFNPATATVVRDGESWKIADGNLRIFDFGANRPAANQALEMIRLHGFDAACFVSRPHMNFTYMKASAPFPEQTGAAVRIQNPPVSGAKPANWKLLPQPWSDEEVLEYTTTRKGSSRSYKSWYLLQSSKTHAGRWVLQERSAGTYYRLEFDAETMTPIESFENTGIIHVRVSYRAPVAQIVENDGKRLAQVVLPGRVFDLRELPIFLGRLPWADGYQAEISLLSGLTSDRVFSYEFAMAGEENVQTPAGNFHCYQIEKYFSGQSTPYEKYWISTDATHLMVKYEHADSVEELSAGPGINPAESVYRNDAAGYTLKLPAGWIVDNEANGGLADLHSSATAFAHLCPCASNATTPEALRFEAEKQAKDEQKYYSLRPQSWQARQVGGRAAVSWIADSNHATVVYTVVYKVMVMTESPTSVLLIRMTADQKSFDAQRPLFDEMIDSMVFK